MRHAISDICDPVSTFSTVDHIVRAVDVQGGYLHAQ